jgi:hypothetical protein
MLAVLNLMPAPTIASAPSTGSTPSSPQVNPPVLGSLPSTTQQVIVFAADAACSAIGLTRGIHAIYMHMGLPICYHLAMLGGGKFRIDGKLLFQHYYILCILVYSIFF